MIWRDEWWRNLSGPRRFIEHSAELLNENGMVLLRVPQDLCWRDALRAEMEEKLRSWFSQDFLRVELDVRDDCPEVRTEQDAFYAILNVLGTRSGSAYRLSAGGISNYLNLEGPNLFAGRLLWVKGFHTQDACRAFSALCARCKRDKVRIVLEDCTGWCNPLANLKEVDYLRFVSPFDTQLLCMMTANECYSSESLLWREYLAILAANLGGFDAELATLLLEECDLRNQSPFHALNYLCQSGYLPQRGATDVHVLYHIQNDLPGGISYVNKLLWKSQLQVGLPILERALRSTVKSLYPQLKRVLKENTILQFNEPVTDPDNLETGTLYYLMDTGKLAVPDYEMRQRIKLLRDSRNRIAHYEVSSQDQMNEVFRLEDTAN